MSQLVERRADKQSYLIYFLHLFRMLICILQVYDRCVASLRNAGTLALHTTPLFTSDKYAIIKVKIRRSIISFV